MASRCGQAVNRDVARYVSTAMNTSCLQIVETLRATSREMRQLVFKIGQMLGLVIQSETQEDATVKYESSKRAFDNLDKQFHSSRQYLPMRLGVGVSRIR